MPQLGGKPRVWSHHAPGCQMLWVSCVPYLFDRFPVYHKTWEEALGRVAEYYRNKKRIEEMVANFNRIPQQFAPNKKVRGVMS